MGRFQVNDGVYQEKLEKETSVHVLAGLVKLFFRELSIPLLQWNVMMELLEIKLEDPFFSALLKAKAEKSAMKRIKKIVWRIDEPSRATLIYFFSHLNDVSQYSDDNQMTAKNLGLMIGPNVSWNPLQYKK